MEYYTVQFALTVAGLLLVTVGLLVWNDKQCKKREAAAAKELAECNRRLREMKAADDEHKAVIADLFKKHIPMSPHAIVTRKAEVPVDHPPPKIPNTLPRV